MERTGTAGREWNGEEEKGMNRIEMAGVDRIAAESRGL